MCTKTTQMGEEAKKQANLSLSFERKLVQKQRREENTMRKEEMEKQKWD